MNPIGQALQLLGDTPDQIAHTLANKGITGQRHVGVQCPIANYLRDQFTFAEAPTRACVTVPEFDVSASGKVPGKVTRLLHVSVHPYNEFPQADETYFEPGCSPVAQFVHKFDNGDYPQLETPADSLGL